MVKQKDRHTFACSATVLCYGFCPQKEKEIICSGELINTLNPPLFKPLEGCNVTVIDAD